MLEALSLENGNMKSQLPAYSYCRIGGGGDDSSGIGKTNGERLISDCGGEKTGDI